MTKRTLPQNRALHLYLTMLSDALNDAGYDVRKVITMPVSFTPMNVKELMLRPIMTALYPEIESTTDLDTKQLSELYEVLNRATAEKLQISIPFPERFNLLGDYNER